MIPLAPTDSKNEEIYITSEVYKLRKSKNLPLVETQV